MVGGWVGDGGWLDGRLVGGWIGDGGWLEGGLVMVDGWRVGW